MVKLIPAGQRKLVVYKEAAPLVLVSSQLAVAQAQVYAFTENAILSFKGGASINSLQTLNDNVGYDIKAAGAIAVQLPDSTLGFGAIPGGGSPSPTPSPSPGTSGTFADSFSNPTLNANWRWINEKPADWSLAIDSGKLRQRRATGHGFFRTPATESEHTPVPVLYHRDQWTLGEGFEMRGKFSFYNPIPFGQCGLLFFTDNPADSSPTQTKIDTYFKLVFEFNISAQLIVILLKETNGVVDNTDPLLVAGASVPGGVLGVELVLNYIGGNLVAKFRPLPLTSAIDPFTSLTVLTSNIAAGTKGYVGIFGESDHIFANNGDTEFWAADDVAFVDGTFTPPPSSSIITFTDDFSVSSANGWVWQNEPTFALANANGWTGVGVAANPAWKIEAGKLFIPQLHQDIFQGSNGAVPVRYRPGITLTAGFSVSVDCAWNPSLVSTGQMGIMLYRDFDNYLKLFARGTETGITFLKEVAGTALFDSANFFNDTAYDSTVSFSLKIEFDGTNIKTFYKAIASSTWIPHFITTPLPGSAAYRVGLFAFNGDDNNTFSTYDNFVMTTTT
jgi:hypothetical protein